jgi:hypothetical protein
LLSFYHLVALSQFLTLKTSLIWDVRQPKLVVGWRRFGTASQSSLQGQTFQDWTARPLKLRPIGCVEMSVTNYEPTHRKVAEDRKPQPHRGETLQSRILTTLLHKPHRKRILYIGRKNTNLYRIAFSHYLFGAFPSSPDELLDCTYFKLGHERFRANPCLPIINEFSYHLIIWTF